MRDSIRNGIALRGVGPIFVWISALSLVLACVGGCTFGRLQVGHPLDATAKANLHLGQAKVEVLELLGPPDRVTMAWEEAVFEYLYREDLDRRLDLSIFQASFDYDQFWLRADRLVVRFDPEGRVRDFGINLQTGASPGSSRSADDRQGDISTKESETP